MAPAASRMSTPETSCAMGKLAEVDWRAQPPFWMRRGALLKVAQNSGRSPTSVGGGLSVPGN